MRLFFVRNTYLNQTNSAFMRVKREDVWVWNAHTVFVSQNIPFTIFFSNIIQIIGMETGD